MKIKNKNNIKIIRFSLIVIFIFLIICALAFSQPSLKIIMTIFAFTAFFTAVFLPYYEFEYSGECISFAKYGLFKTNYIRPFIEIPVLYITDYEINRVLMIYFLKITIEDGFSSKKRMTKISLQFFSDYQIIKIIKTLESIKKKNTDAKVKL